MLVPRDKRPVLFAVKRAGLSDQPRVRFRLGLAQPNLSIRVNACIVAGLTLLSSILLHPWRLHLTAPNNFCLSQFIACLNRNLPLIQTFVKGLGIVAPVLDLPQVTKIRTLPYRFFRRSQLLVSGYALPTSFRPMRATTRPPSLLYSMST